MKRPLWFVGACLLVVFALPAAHADEREDVAAVIGEVLYAAQSGDLELLAGHMAESFTYSFGDAPSKHEALARLKAEPALLAELARVIGQGCRLEPPAERERWYVCPFQFADKQVIYFGYRAGFRKDPDGPWRLRYFVAGD